MKEAFAAITAIIGAIVFVMVFGMALGWWGLRFNRLAMPYAEETRRLTYSRSVAYQQGSQRDFENLCLQWAQATDAGARAVIADTIRRRAQDYVGPPLADNVQSCLSRVGQ